MANSTRQSLDKKWELTGNLVLLKPQKSMVSNGEDVKFAMYLTLYI